MESGLVLELIEASIIETLLERVTTVTFSLLHEPKCKPKQTVNRLAASDAILGAHFDAFIRPLDLEGAGP